jgi:MFS transporter, ACS family, hexuronate transporter
VTPTDPSVRIGRFRWAICALLFFATTINYIDRQILSLVKEQLDRELGWTATQFGLVNSAFQGAYGISLIAFGWFIDRKGIKLGYALSIATWSVMAALHGLVGSVGGFVAARIGLGLGEGGNFPAAIKTVATWFPTRERAFATSLFNSGSNVGAVLAPMLVPPIATTLGWRWAFLLAGAAGLIWLCFWLPLFTTPDRSRRLREPERALISEGATATPAATAPTWGRLLGTRHTWGFIAAKSLTDPVWWFFLIWLPDFFKKVYGLDIKSSWTKLVAIYAIVTVLSIFGGWFSGALLRRGWSVTRARKTAMLIFAACVVPVFMATRQDVWPAVLLIALAGAAHQAWSATLFTTVSDVFPRSAVGRVIGLGGAAGAITGMLFPIYCGWELDRYRMMGNEAGAYSHILSLCAFAYLATFAIHHLLSPAFEPDPRVADTKAA